MANFITQLNLSRKPSQDIFQPYYLIVILNKVIRFVTGRYFFVLRFNLQPNLR